MNPPHPVTRRTMLSLTGLGVLGALGTAACGGSGSGGPGSPVQLYADTPTWLAALKKAGAQLQRVTGVPVKPTTLPVTVQYEQVMKQSLKTTKAPGIMKWWSGYRIQEIARTGAIADLTSTWHAAEAKNWVNPKLRSIFTWDGKVYGLPISSSTWVMYYNKKLFARYGLAVPQTWDDVISAANKFKVNGITPFYANTKIGWPSFIWFSEIMTRLNPVFYQDLVNGNASYTDPPAAETMKIWQGLLQHGMFTPFDMDETTAIAQMKAGKLAMMPYGTWAGIDFAAGGMTPGTDFDAFITPMIDPSKPRSVIVESGTWVVPTRAPDRDQSVKVLGAWMQPSVQQTWCDLLVDSSANQQVPAADELLAHISTQIRQQDMMLMNRYWEASPPALVENAVGILGGFMQQPGNYQQTLSSLQKNAGAQWAAWKQGQ